MGKLPSSVQNLLGKDARDSPDTSADKKQRRAKRQQSRNGFRAFSLPDDMLSALDAMKFNSPTPIQKKALPLLLTGRDTVLMSRTGSGKTLTFLLPLFRKLKSHSKEIGVRGLIVSPTRELALQTYRVACSLVNRTPGMDLRICPLMGGDSMDYQFGELAKNPDVIIATPGRLVHMMDLVHSFSLSRVSFVAFDEADRLFELGFKMQVEEIIKNIPKSQARQVVMVSATLPKALAEFAQAGLRNPATVRLDVEDKLPPDLKLCYLTAKSHEKWAAFLHAIREIIPQGESTLIFVATRHHAEFLHMLMRKLEYDPAMVYGKMDFEARKEELNAFESGRKNFLIVTDVAARGIDIPLLNNVVNVHFPSQPKLFLHRVGRAARAGRRGVALSIICPEEMPYLIELLNFLKKPMLSLEGEIDLIDGGHARPASSENERKENVDKGLETIFSLKDGYESILNQFDGYFGSIPSNVLQTELDFIVKQMTNDVSLQSQFQTGVRAYKLYKKTRSAPSNASLRRAREIFHKNSDLPVHPLCAKKMGSKQSADNYQQEKDFTRSVSNYKPKQTVFELVTNSKEYNMMQKLRKKKAFQNHFKSSKDKRFDPSTKEEYKLPEQSTAKEEPKSLAEKLLSRASENQAGEGTVGFGEQGYVSKHRNKEFFMDYDNNSHQEEKEDERHYQINELTNVKQHVFALTGEDQEDIMRDRRQLVWDKKKRKYIHRHLLAGQRLGANKKIKNEAGVMVSRKDATKDDKTYTKWRQKTGARIQSVGETEESFSLPDKKLMTRRARLQIASEKARERREKNAYLREHNITNSHYQHLMAKKKNELRNVDQMEKEERQKQKDQFTKDTFERVKKLGKRKVREELAQQGQRKKAKMIHDHQKALSDRQRLKRVQRREQRHKGKK